MKDPFFPLKRLVFVVLHRWGLYARWCRIYQGLFDRRFFLRPNRWDNLEPEAAAALLRLLVWQPDGVQQLWDAAGHPGRTTALIDRTIDMNVPDRNEADRLRNLLDTDPAGFRNRLLLMRRGIAQKKTWGQDCEDFALWAACALKVRYDPVVLTVVWSDGIFSCAGHSVCLFLKESGRYGMVSNWVVRGDYDHLDQAVNAVMELCRAGGREVGRMIYSPEDLTWRPR